MSKDEYFLKLRKALEEKRLPRQYIDRIISEQNVFIYDATTSGRTEVSVIKSLGDPKNFTNSANLEVSSFRLKTSTRFWDIFKDILSASKLLIDLMPINILVFVLTIIPFMFLILSWLTISFFIALGGAILFLAQFAIAFFFGFEIMQTLALTFLTLSIFLLGITSLALCYLVVRFFVKLFARYTQWNARLYRRKKTL